MGFLTCVHILPNGGIWDLHLDLFTLLFLCLLQKIFFFFPRIPAAVLGGLGGGKEGKKSPLVSAPKNHHLQPSCHPTWIKSPSVMAAAPLTRGFTLSCGVGGGGGWGRG